MHIEQIWSGNDFRNFHYLIACPRSGEALVIDPLDHALCLQRAAARGFRITQVLNTHEHLDHTGGNGPMIEPRRSHGSSFFGGGGVPGGGPAPP